MSWNSKQKVRHHDPHCDKGEKPGYGPLANELNIDRKALFLGETFLKVIAREATHRQCAAAQVSALFHLVYGSKADGNNRSDDESNVQKNNDDPPKYEGDAQMAQGYTQKGKGDTQKDKVDTQKGDSQRPNYNRDGIDASSIKFACTQWEPVRLDTGIEYHKLPLGSFVKVLETKGDKHEVERITGIFSDQAKRGWVPCEHVKVIPYEYVPIHVVMAEKLTGHAVTLDDKVIENQSPFFDAGPKSKSLKVDDVIKIKDVSQEFTNINLLDEEGQSIGFGRIRTASLVDAKKDLAES